MHSNYVGVYLPRRKGGRRLRSVEKEYKAPKINGGVRLLGNKDPALETVREFEQQAARTGRRSIFKEAVECAEEFGLEIWNTYKRSGRKCIKVKSRS